MTLQLEGREIATDKEGYLRELGDWDEAVAAAIARTENIDLTAEHWEVIHCIRRFYQEFGLSPAMRPLVKYLGQQLGPEKGRSIHLMQLFPGSPAKLVSKIAGLPRPDNCL